MACLEISEKDEKKYQLMEGNELNVLTVEDMRSVEVIVLQHYQEPEYKELYEFQKWEGRPIKKVRKNTGCLNTCLDEKVLIVGGQLRLSGLEKAAEYPIF